MNNTKKFKILQALIAAKFFLILIIGIFVSSCNKPTEMGLDVQPANDMLNVGIDSTILITKTVREDSLRTEQFAIAATGLIGKYFDPIFGECTSSLYTKLTLLTPRTFDTIPVCDSVILSLVYTGDPYPKVIKGKQTLNVFQLTEEIKTETPYFSHSKIPFQTKDLASGFSFTANVKDSIKIKKDQKIKPQLRLQLDKKFGDDILKSGKLANNVDFQTFLKGLYITTENTTGLISGDGNILNFSLGESRITIYHRGLKTDSILYIAVGDLRFSHFNHAYATTAIPDINLQLNSAIQTQNDFTYIQCMAGVKTRIEIPNIMEMKKHLPLGINRSELVIKVMRESLKDSLKPPPTLFLYGITDDGKSYLLPDAQESSVYFDGVYNSKKYEYRFNIARYTQKVLNGELKNNGLYLVATSAVTNANRVVIGGGGMSNLAGNPYQMKLYITYTK